MEREEEETVTDHDRMRIDRKHEMRTKAISKMISEGGLGADNYYNIIKESSTKEEKNWEDDSNETREN